jgi:hypothetical protein
MYKCERHKSQWTANLQIRNQQVGGSIPAGGSNLGNQSANHPAANSHSNGFNSRPDLNPQALSSADGRARSPEHLVSHALDSGIAAGFL